MDGGDGFVGHWVRYLTLLVGLVAVFTRRILGIVSGCLAN